MFSDVRLSLTGSARQGRFREAIRSIAWHKSTSTGAVRAFAVMIVWNGVTARRRSRLLAAGSDDTVFGRHTDSATSKPDR